MMKRDKRLTPEQVQEILRLYPNEKSEIIAEKFKVEIATIYKTAQRYGVKKSEAFKNSPHSGRIQKGQRLSPETELKKGHTPATKGKKLSEFIKSEAALEAVKKHIWKKGNKPHNTGTDGEIRWRKNPGYWFVRISENNWEFYHRHLWEQANGVIQDGYNVVFKDGNRRNCVIENLECISNAELGERNRVTKYPLEIREAIIETNKLAKALKTHGYE